MKYKFTALFEDGEKIIQNDQDVSTIDPKRSSYYDVVEKQKEKKLIAFGLYGDGAEYLVDLRNGRFCVNGRDFILHEESYLQDFRLIYFRRNTLTFNTPHESKSVEFVIGWQTTYEGKNYQQKMIFP